MILVNEPTQVLTNVPNSDIYYNVYYPRWIYDQYRQYVNNAAMQNHWNYLDLWNIFPPSYFTDTPLHLNPRRDGTREDDCAVYRQGMSMKYELYVYFVFSE